MQESTLHIESKVDPKESQRSLDFKAGDCGKRFRNSGGSVQTLEHQFYVENQALFPRASAVGRVS